MSDSGFKPGRLSPTASARSPGKLPASMMPLADLLQQQQQPHAMHSPEIHAKSSSHSSPTVSSTRVNKPFTPSTAVDYAQPKALGGTTVTTSSDQHGTDSQNPGTRISLVFDDVNNKNTVGSALPPPPLIHHPTNVPTPSNRSSHASQGKTPTTTSISLPPPPLVIIPPHAEAWSRPPPATPENNTLSTKPKAAYLTVNSAESNNYAGTGANNNLPSIIAVARESSFISTNNAESGSNGRTSLGAAHACAACGATGGRLSGGNSGGSPKSSARPSPNTTTLFAKIGQAVSATVEHTTLQLSHRAGLSARHLHEAMGNALEWQQQHDHMHYTNNEMHLTPSEQQMLAVARAVEQHRPDVLTVPGGGGGGSVVVEGPSGRTSYPIPRPSATNNQQHQLQHQQQQQRSPKSAKFYHSGLSAPVLAEHHQKPPTFAETKLLGPRPQQLLNERFSNESSSNPHHANPHHHQRFRPVTHFDEPECGFRISSSHRTSTTCLSAPVIATGSTAVRLVPGASGIYHPIPADSTALQTPHFPLRSSSSPIQAAWVDPAAVIAPGGLQLRVLDSPSSSEPKLLSNNPPRHPAAGSTIGVGVNEGFLYMADAALFSTSFELYAPRSTPPPPLSVVLQAQQRMTPKNPSLLHVPTSSAVQIITTAPPPVVPVQRQKTHFPSFTDRDSDTDSLSMKLRDSDGNHRPSAGGTSRLPSSNERREFFSTNPWLAETRHRFRRYFIFVYLLLATVMLLFWLQNIIIETQLSDKVALQNADRSVQTFAYQLLLTSLGQEMQFSAWKSAQVVACDNTAARVHCSTSSCADCLISTWQSWTDASLQVTYEYLESAGNADMSWLTSLRQTIASARLGSTSASPDAVFQQYNDLAFAAWQQPLAPRDFSIMHSIYLYQLLSAFSTTGAIVLYPQRVTNSTEFYAVQAIFCSSWNSLAAITTAVSRHASSIDALLLSDNSSNYALLQTQRIFIDSLYGQTLEQFHALPPDQSLSRLQQANNWAKFIAPWSSRFSDIALNVRLFDWFPSAQAAATSDVKVAFLRQTVENYRNGGVPGGGTSSEIFGTYWRNGDRLELFFIIPVLLMLLYVVYYEWRSRGTLGVLLTILFEAVYDASRTNVEMERARAISRRLILYHFPPAIAKRLFDTNIVMPESYLMSTIMFVEIDSFNLISQFSTPTEIVKFLDGYYETLEALLRRHPLVTQIHTTLMSTHLLASGIPTRTPAHAFEACTVALEILRQFYYFCIPHFVGPYGARSRLHLRVGCHSGTAVAAVVGVNQIRYSVFGDTVNLASRMQDYGYPRLCVMSRDTFRELEAYDPEHGSSRHFITKSRGEIRMKGKGRVAMMWLLGSAQLQFSLDVKKEKYLYNVHCLARHKPTECVLFRPGKGGH